jgi:hypothetical protein
MPNITVQDKLECVVRELRYRRRVYPRLIANGKMSQAEADREIAIMEILVEDYDGSAKMRQPEVFSDDDAA